MSIRGAGIYGGDAGWAGADSYGDWQRLANLERIAGMTQPSRCTWCGGIYDLGTVTVTARYTDCSMWKAPCCGVTADDRGETGWKSRSDYVRLDSQGREVRRG